MESISRRSLLLGAAGVVGLAACGSSAAKPSASTAAGSTTGPTAAASGGATTLRLGLFPNVTHATALAGVQQGIFAKALGSTAKLETSSYTNGSKAIEALFADAIDASYLGPNPAINGWAKSKGKALHIVSGATSGGAFLVVKPGITDPAQLKGKKLATPGLGNTQDVALRSWLKSHQLSADESGGGDVSVVPQDNSATLDAFKSGDIDGAWVPEPWASRLVLEGGGTVLVDERTLWPNGKYVTTHLVVATKFLDAHPDVVKAILQGQVEANQFVNTQAEAAQKAVNDQIEAITQKRMNDATLAAAWKNLTFTNDPIASSLRTSADAAIAIGLLDQVDLTGIYALDLLNQVLSAAGQPAVAGL